MGTGNQRHGSATEQFLLAAKYAEIHTLEQLAASCEVVAAVSDLIHQLQRERGISNIYLASAGERFSKQRQQQAELSAQSERQLRELLNMHYIGASEPVGSLRLLNSIAFVLQGLDDLAELRRRIKQQEMSALDSTRALCRLIAGLLSVVFEAADIAGDPAVTRVLVALFNLMQGKEYAGQERAWAAIGFATGRFDQSLCERLSHLKSVQNRSFEVFTEFAAESLVMQWQTLDSSDNMVKLKQLRVMIQRLGQGEPIAPSLSEVWYDLATQRIDEMRLIENALAASLSEVSQQQVEAAQTSLKAHKQRLQALATIESPPSSPLTMLFDPQAPGLHGADGTPVPAATASAAAPDLARSMYDLVRGQADHIARMNEELEDARRALRERKLVERAKGLLMQNLGLTEEQAYRKMQQRAMELNTRIGQVAATLIEAGERVAGKGSR